MKVAHVVNWTPGACGMYETVRDLVIAERSIGINARIIDASAFAPPPLSAIRPAGDPCEKCGYVRVERLVNAEAAPDWSEDRGVVKAPAGWLEEVDVICSHSGMPADVPGAGNKPRVHVAHGRPHSSFLLGQLQNNHVWKAYASYAKDDRWKALVTLWPGFGRYWRLVFPRRVEEFSPFVDLAMWVPTESGYKFGGRGGKPNVVISDVWRQDKDPFHCIFAFAAFAEKYPEARLHVYGLQPSDASALAPVLDALSGKGVLGEVKGRVDNLVSVYNAADLLITPHAIATRTIREASACGLPVVAGGEQPYTPYKANPEDVAAFAEVIAQAWQDVSSHRDARRNDARTMAETLFDPVSTAKQFGRLFGEITA